VSKGYNQPPVNHARPNQSGVTLELPSGFSIRVRPMPPYYLDIIDDAIPLPDYPKRQIILAAGDIIYVDYVLPDEPVPVEHEDYQLYMRWKYVDTVRKELETLRSRARKDFMLSTCVDILSGPLDYRNHLVWIPKVEAAFPDYKVPEHKGKRMLIFLKTFVISSPEWMDVITRTALAEEATMQGIMTALQAFQNKVGPRIPLGTDPG
jgi:hypothetical protein